jgi:protein-tyrosine phosphatase
MQIPPASSDATSAPLIRDALADRAAHQFRSTRIVGSLPARFDSTGFAGLGMSGSSQFSEFGWQEIRKHLAGVPDEEIFVLDFREESHGFLNGNAVSWYAAHNWGNAGLSAAEAVAIEELRLSILRKSDVVDVLVGHEVRDRKAVPAVVGPENASQAPPAPLPMPANFYCAINTADRVCPSENGQIAKKGQIDRKQVECWKMDRVASEREIVALPAGHYSRFPVTDHLRPSDEIVNAFIAFAAETAARRRS